MSVPSYTLNDGTEVPVIGFGTYPLRGEDGIRAMTSAVEAGYRYLDSAVNYENEEEVGEAVRRSGLPREDLQVATKIPGRFHEHDLAVASASSTGPTRAWVCTTRPGRHWWTSGSGDWSGRSG
jgi:2,5-diketo-D-gluconate reductase A